MKLTPEVVAALKRLRMRRNNSNSIFVTDRDEMILADFMLAACPPGHADEITVERLVACGGDHSPKAEVITFGDRDAVYCLSDVAYYTATGSWSVCGDRIPQRLRPKDMGDVLELLAKCGIEASR